MALRLCPRSLAESAVYSACNEHTNTRAVPRRTLFMPEDAGVEANFRACPGVCFRVRRVGNSGRGRSPKRVPRRRYLLRGTGTT